MSLIKTNARSASALDATILTGNLPAISGSSLTGVSAGKVLQFVRNTSTSEITNTSTSSTVDGVPTANFTPTSASSKIYLQWNIHVRTNVVQGSIDGSIQYEIFRDSTLLFTSSSVINYISAGFSGHTRQPFIFNYLDTPNTTSQVTYKYKFKKPHNTTTIYVGGGGSATHTLTIWEIEG